MISMCCNISIASDSTLRVIEPSISYFTEIPSGLFWLLIRLLAGMAHYPYCQVDSWAANLLAVLVVEMIEMIHDAVLPCINSLRLAAAN